MFATSINTNSPQVTIGLGGHGPAATTSVISKGGGGSGGGRRRSRRSSRPKFVHVLHPGHDGRVAFVIPSADVTSLGTPVDGDSPVPGSANGTPDGMAAGGTVEGAASALSPLPTLCPSCLPVFDPLSTDECPVAGKQKNPFPSTGGGGCALVHAALDCATRHEVHRRTDGLLGLGARYQDAGHERASPGQAGSIDVAVAVAAADGASVLVGMPNLPTERELVRPSTCLVTQADLCPKGAAPSSEEAVADGEAPDAPDDAPRHCVHWLQRGICIYGSSCRFVHCLEPSERCIAVLRSAVSEQQKQRRASNALNDDAPADSPPGVLERASSETPSLASPLTAMTGANIAKPVHIALHGQGQDAADQGGTRQQPLAARVLPPGGIRIPGVGAAPQPSSSAQHQSTPGADGGARRAPNPPPPSMAGPPAQAVSGLLPHSAVMSAGITANGPPAPQPLQYLYQHQPPPGYAFQAGPQLIDPAQAPQFYQHHYQQYLPSPSALPQAQHPQYPQVIYTMQQQQQPQHHHAFVPMLDSHPQQQQQLWQQQLQPQQSRPPHPQQQPQQPPSQPS
jgi:hypothetical protein